jgi:hypothetical protein
MTCCWKAYNANFLFIPWLHPTLLDSEKLRVREHAYPHVFQGFLVFLCSGIPQIETSVNRILFNQTTEVKFKSNFFILN